MLTLRLARWIATLWLALASALAYGALSADDLKLLADDSASEKLAAIDALVASGDPRAALILKAMREDALSVLPDGTLVITEGNGHVDALSGAKASPDVASLEAVTINNRVRSRLDGALAAFDLLSPDVSVRTKSIAALEKAYDPALAPLVESAFARETSPDLKARLRLVRAAHQLASDDRTSKLEAIAQLGGSDNAATRLLLLPFVEKNPDGRYRETDDELRAAAERAIRAIDSSQRKGELAGAVIHRNQPG